MPNIGYGTKKADRFKARKTGKYTFVLRNVNDLECVKNQGDLYDVYLGRSLNVRTRKEIIAKAAEMGLRVLNKSARMKTEEAE